MNFVDYKCLESLLIEGKELSIANEKTTWIEDTAKNVSYFGKKWNCNTFIHVPEERVDEAKTALNKFISASNSLSTKYESWMINQIKSFPWLDDLIEGKDIPQNISKYTDIPDLTLGDIEVATTYRTKKIVVIISGGYAIDEEHGWAIAFINNKPVGKLSESGSIHNEYANEATGFKLHNPGLKSFVKNELIKLIPFAITNIDNKKINVSIIVNDYSYSVDFKFISDGVTYNGMKMVDDGMIKEKDFDKFGKNIADYIRKSKVYNNSKNKMYKINLNIELNHYDYILI